MARLHSLRCDFLFAADLIPSITAIVRSLTSLHHSRCWGVDSLLPELTRFPATPLRCLILQPCCAELEIVGLSSIPSALAVQQLLLAAPELQCRILLQPFPPPSRFVQSEWDRVLNTARAIQQSMETAKSKMEPAVQRRLSVVSEFPNKA
jgi:hypothetical protein